MSPWAVVRQAPLSMGFSRQGYWSGVPLPSPTNHWAARQFPHPLNKCPFLNTEPHLLYQYFGLTVTFAYVVKPKL